MEQGPGDFGWDPANIKPADSAAFEELQTKELKNGRLAMTGVAGLALQALVVEASGAAF